MSVFIYILEVFLMASLYECVAFAIKIPLPKRIINILHKIVSAFSYVKLRGSP